MVYDFRFGGYTWDTVPVENLPESDDVQKHMDKVCKENNLPYVTPVLRKVC